MTAPDRPACAPRRVLMVCYLYPPLLTSGVNRSVGFAQHLPECGWEPTVLTVSGGKESWSGRGESVPGGVPVVRSSEWNLEGLVELGNGVLSRLASIVGKDLRRNYVRDLLCVPDTQLAWFSTLPGARLARLSDVIYVSCSPFSSALSGVFIKRLSGRPLVVDFRDTWSPNPHTPHTRVHKAVARRIERFVLRHTDALVLNTEGARAVYARAYPECAHRFHVIPNGYDDLPSWTPPSTARDGIVILHVGSFYGTRTPDRFFEALSAIRHDDVQFWHVGPRHPVLDAWQGRLNIRTFASLPHAQVVDLWKDASLLYLKQGFEPGVTDYIAVAAKTYEYIATGLPILAECPEGDNASIVRQYCRHAFVVTEPSVEAIRAQLSMALGFCRRELPGMQPPPQAFLDRFARAHLTEQLAAVLDSVARPSGEGRDEP